MKTLTTTLNNYRLGIVKSRCPTFFLLLNNNVITSETEREDEGKQDPNH